MKRLTVIRISIVVLCTVMALIAGYKVIVLGYTFEDIIPQPGYSVTLKMIFSGTGDDVVVRTFLPVDGKTQVITGEIIDSPDLDFNRVTQPEYTRGDWSRYSAEGPYSIRYSFTARIRPVVYNLDPELKITESYTDGFDRYLTDTEVIQVDDPFIKDLLIEVTGESEGVQESIRSIYEYVYELGSRPFKGMTDAVTAAKLGEASCNGKSRLFVALMRGMGIPSRLVGGFILTPGTKRTSHQWAEVYLEGHWVPFDTLNGYYASLPGNYLVLYRGDESLFRHSRNIGFDYQFTIRRQSSTNLRLAGYLGGRALNLYNLLAGILQTSVSLEVLQFLLVIPLGVLFVVVARNVIGAATFGTFLPALMAMAVKETGFLPGIAAFLLVIGVTVLVRFPLERLGMLHTPKLAVMMVVVIMSLLLLSVIAGLTGMEAFATIGAATLFPIAILTITSERFAITISEEGLRPALTVMLQTLIVMGACYLVMSSVALQALVIAFPEILLGVIALNLWLGHWTGIRLSELIRFRSLYAGTGETHGV